MQSWDIILTNWTVDFGPSSVDEAVLEYRVGKYRDVAQDLYAGECESPHVEIAGVEYNLTEVTTPGPGATDGLVLRYSFDNSQIASSNV